jgi:hypothetical protein
MASAFWTLEDGRGFVRQWRAMAYMLEVITDEIREIEGAAEFYKYLEYFVYREENGDLYNGYGGFIRGNDNLMFNIDLRTFAPQNRDYFWHATQRALAKLKVNESDQNEWIILLLTTLMDMHKRIELGEDPTLLNHMRTVKPETTEKLGPGW